MTNYELIKTMSPEQMLDWINDTSDCATCAFRNCGGSPDECRDGHKLWLQQEAKE